MLCRGYGANACLHIGKKPLSAGEVSFFAGALTLIALSAVLIYLHP
jgi:hypothetical protein